MEMKNLFYKKLTKLLKLIQIHVVKTCSMVYSLGL